MSAAPRVADLLLDPILDGIQIVAGSAGVERRVTDVLWYEGDFEQVEGALMICGEAHVSPPYRLDALVRRAQEARAAALLVVAGPAHPLLSSMRLADRLEIPVLWLDTREPVRLMLELNSLVRAPETVRARTVERLLRQLAAKRSGTDILAAAETVLSVKLSLVTSDGSAIRGRKWTSILGCTWTNRSLSAASTCSCTRSWTPTSIGSRPGSPAPMTGPPTRGWTSSPWGWP